MKLTLYVAAGYLACQLLASGPAWCDTAKNTHPTAEQLSKLSTEMLHHVDLARQAISNKNTASAQQHVTQALADQNRIASLAKSKNLPMIIPLYSEFDTSATLGPLEQARKSGQKSSPNASHTVRNRFAPVTVDETSAEYTYVGIDLAKAKERLEAAKTALNNKNLQSADDSLAALDNDLVMQTVTTDMPLLTARENLGIAEDAVKNNHYKEGTAALKEAANDLNRFASSNPPQHADDAKKLSGDIQPYADSLSNSHTGAADKIDGWWHQVDNWFTHPSES